MNSNITMNRFDDIDTRAGLQAYLGNTNTFDRDLYSTFGWIEDPDEEDYYATYLRNPVAKAVVDKPAETTWRHDPEIKDGDDETETEFEQAVTRLDREHDHWNYCSRVDKLAGIGEYGILVIGFADGEDLDQPVSQEEISGIDDIAWFRVFPQISITDVTIDQDPQSDRWGEVESYDVDLSDADDADDATMVGDVEIHHSRVVHVPSTELLDDEIRGTPRQEPVFNVINDIEKVFGAASEMSYRGADYGLHIDVDPEYEFDADSLNEELQRYVNNLQNFIKTQGTSIEQIGGEVTDPSGLIDNLMGLIVAGAPYAPPKRLLMGSEQAELASSQDKANYFGRIQERQTQYGGDYIARPLLRKLINFGVLPTPKNNLFDLSWPDLFELNDIEQAEVKNKRATTLKNLAPQGNTDLIATEQKRLEYLETGDTDVLQTEQSDTQPMPAPGEETPAQQEAFGEFFLNDDFNPELHPRGPDGKFVESPGGGVGDTLSTIRDTYTAKSETITVGGESVESRPVLTDVFSHDQTEVKQAALEALDETFVQEQTYGPDRHGAYSDFNAWREEQQQSLLNDSTAELWGAAIDDTGNDNVPEDAVAESNTVGDPLPAIEGQEPITAIGDSVKVTREVLRKTFGDTVPVVRGVNGEFADQLREAKENGEKIELNHRALESWSTFPDHAQQFANEGEGDGVLITTEVPVDRIYGASHSTPGLTEDENEIIAALDETVTYSPEQIHPGGDKGLAEVYKKMNQSV